MTTEPQSVQPPGKAQSGAERMRRSEVEVSDASDLCRLLRARRERPRRCSSHQRDEFPSPHRSPLGPTSVAYHTPGSEGALCGTAISDAACPLWVISCRGAVKVGCPLSPRKLPPQSPTGAAVKGQKQTPAVQQNARMLIRKRRPLWITTVDAAERKVPRRRCGMT
jgi:hypothetical protein